jgi:hypothetical protein
MRILKIESLPSKKHWIDRDEIMIHSCFQILKDAIELEKVDTHVDYETHKDFVDEARFLYDWWVKRSVAEEPDFEEDDKMLLRLMKIRTQLWT